MARDSLPYRVNALVAAPRVRARWRRAALAAGVAVLATACGVGLVWARSDWTEVAELRTTKEELPPHAPLASITWNAEGTLAFAVGARGGIFERTSALGELDAPRWARVASGVDEDLTSIADGDGPSLGGGWGGTPELERRFIVGARGTLVDCSPRAKACVVVPTGTDATLRGVAIDGKQALIVGDHGTLLHVRADAEASARWRVGQARERPREEVDLALRIEPVSLPGVTDDLRAVDLRCDDGPASLACTATVRSAAGVRARGRGVGRCDDDFHPSGAAKTCAWTWSVEDPAGPVANDDSVRAPVHLAGRRLWARRDRVVVASVGLGATPIARVGDATWPLRLEHRFVRGVWPSLDEGRAALFVGDDGEIYLAVIAASR